MHAFYGADETITWHDLRTPRSAAEGLELECAVGRARRAT